MWGDWDGEGCGAGFPVGGSQVQDPGIKEENEIPAPGSGFSLGLGSALGTHKQTWSCSPQLERPTLPHRPRAWDKEF